MANANPNYSALIATTIENRSSDLYDNVTNSNAILAAIKGSKGTETISGGTAIVKTISTGQNDNATFYTGYETFGIGEQDVISAARFELKQAVCPVTISGTEILQNKGKEAMINLLKGKVDVAESTLKNIVTQGIYSDGTLYSGKGITGLQAALPLANTSGTYGGIDRSVATNTFWRNKKWKCTSVDGSAAASASNIQGYLNALYFKTLRGTDQPNLIMMDPNYYAFFVASLQALQRFTSAEVGKLGFPSIKYQAADVILEQTVAGIPASTAYVLNTDYIKFVTHKDRNFVALDSEAKSSVNQDAFVQTIAWAGNLVSMGPQFCGVMQE